MATTAVVVHDLNDLESFGDLLRSKSAELDALYRAMVTACNDQETNWADPQYDYLKAELEDYAAAAVTQLEQLDAAADYIEALVNRLRAV